MSQFDFKKVVKEYYNSYPDFARSLDISVPTARKYVAYPQTMSLGMLFTIAEDTGLDIKELVELILKEDD